MAPAGPDKSAGRTNGVLPISVTQQPGEKNAKNTRTKAKAAVEGVKMVVRYLPPGMKESEYIDILDDEWKVGNGKVDWFAYEPGKVAKTPGKPSRPSVVYVHLTKVEFAQPFVEAVRNATWEDSANTYHDPALLFPPFVERCAFQRIPPSKERVDPRQGTIDTDPDFMAFLEELANPKPAPPESADQDSNSQSGPTVTPLIEFLKAKKANKEKDASTSKSGKSSRQDAKGSKGKGTDESKKGKEKSERGEKPKEEVKILLKKAAPDSTKDSKSGTGKKPSAPAPAAAASSTQPAASSSSSDAAPKSRRAGIAAAARILQRDLGLSPGTAHRRARLDAAKAEAEAKATTPSQQPTSSGPSASKGSANASSQPSTPTASAANNQPSSGSGGKPQSSTRSRGRGSKNAEQKGKSSENATNGSGPSAANPPIVLKKRSEPATSTNQGASSATETPATQKATAGESSKSGVEKSKAATQKKNAAITPGATRGFVKHANPSQGVTEALLKQTLGTFGDVTFVEIDKRKGFAYVDFAEHGGLVKAIAASPVSIAQATVQVLERKEKKPAQAAQAPSSASGSGTANATAPAEKEKEKPSHRSRRGRRGGGGGGGGGSEKSAASASTAAASAGGPGEGGSSKAKGGTG
ncbi:hypothetical protein jhhlp_003830 [Lomentospora prolificans]|uniref:RRM domain-containing protein n=1 Tax=Lomentospora prolificans TaxID=41688 RepID=A0A2N3N9U2_9PEZI|nr:hypothetical protein jhhlp_003830 [Lomentospora prolificans]